MRNSISLFATGLLYAFIGWAFWHYLGSDAPSALATLLVVAFACDNARLRRELREKNKE